MAKHKEKISSYPFPSRFGSHSSMVISDAPESGSVLCEDEYGQYVTLASRIDNGLSDPNRTSQKRLSKLFSGKKE